MAYLRLQLSHLSLVDKVWSDVDYPRFSWRLDEGGRKVVHKIFLLQKALPPHAIHGGTHVYEGKDISFGRESHL